MDYKYYIKSIYWREREHILKRITTAENQAELRTLAGKHYTELRVYLRKTLLLGRHIRAIEARKRTKSRSAVAS